MSTSPLPPTPPPARSSASHAYRSYRLYSSSLSDPHQGEAILPLRSTTWGGGRHHGELGPRHHELQPLEYLSPTELIAPSTFLIYGTRAQGSQLTD
ncbi:hypothetical protein PR202_gb26177 [Eleusine coracana subsp. coracana]|uniref:Uncharacterized protein n=1 Tax=Eleusine coracana subsp. coracana TaxID=191504 RepID=A0AAV5FQT2_ELECO|nr:hypothetical protein PR202_gb26149 [Eleusine coracana subsp. coracana]GJN37246.1 hypothetical protein PR202_gb26177 [Eleusine coracana subsp. coracana]